MAQLININSTEFRRCNLSAIQSGGTWANIVPDENEIILVSTTNSLTADGSGNCDAYIEGDGTKAATELELKYLDADLREEVYGTGTQVNLSSYPNVMFTINANGVWATTTNLNHSIFVPMQDGEYTLTASPSAPALYTVLTSNDTPTAGATPAYATGYSNRIQIPAGGTATVQGASDLYLWMRNDTATSGAMAPTVMFDSGLSRIDELEERITPLEEELEESEVETKVITTYTPSCLIMADSTNADFGNVVPYNNADYAVSPFIDISGYNKLSVTTLTSTAQAGAGTVLYNANKEPLVGYFKNVAPSSFTIVAEIPEEAAYIRITNWSSTFSAGNVKLRLWDTLKEFTIRKTAELDSRINALESSGGIPSGLAQYEYIGERISFVPKCAVSAYMSLKLTGTGQGGAVFGDYYYVGVNHNSVLNVFNLSTKTKIGTISLEAVDITNCHANTLTFSNQYHTDGDEFPILYICSGYALDNNTKMYGYRIVNNNDVWSATLVHTITIANSTWTDGVIDNIRQKLWIKDVRAWYCVDMPQYANGNATIDLSEATPEFSYPSYEGSAQGHLFYNDKIYFSSGLPGSENVSRLYVLNTKTGKCDSEINLLPILGVSHEPENVFVYNGHFFVASRHNVFRMYFE